MTQPSVQDIGATTQVDAHFIDGAWQTAGGPERIEVFDSNTGTVIGHAPSGTAADVDAAVQGAKRAQWGWAALTPAERGKHLRAAAAGLQARQEELAQIISREVGAPIAPVPRPADGGRHLQLHQRGADRR